MRAHRQPLALQQDAVVDDADPVEPVHDISFNPIPVQHSVDDILIEPDATQQSWLWTMLSGMGKRMQALPSSREAPEHLARYQRLDGVDGPPDEASFFDGPSSGRRTAETQPLDEAVLKHLQELQALGSAPMRGVKTDVLDPDQQWFLLDHDDDRAGPNALHTDALPNGGVAEIATNQAKLWREVAQEETPLDLNALPRSSHHVRWVDVVRSTVCDTITYTVCGVDGRPPRVPLLQPGHVERQPVVHPGRWVHIGDWAPTHTTHRPTAAIQRSAHGAQRDRAQAPAVVGHDQKLPGGAAERQHDHAGHHPH